MTIFVHMAAGICWTVTLGLMAIAPATAHTLYCVAWALLCAMVACLLTGWLMLRCERHRIETVAQLAVSAADEHRRLESI